MSPWLTVVEVWTVVALGLTGLGLLVERLIRAPLDEGDAWLLAFWLGWAAAVCVLQVWHLVRPVDDAVRIGLGAAGLVGLATAGRRAWGALVGGIVRSPLAVVATLAVGAWLAHRGLAGPQNGDSGFYHIPTIRWLLTYPVVPGLANLFAALAYNQSYFLYAALLDGGPMAGGSHHVANALLVLALFARVLVGLGRLVRTGRACSPVDLFWALFLPGAFGLAFDLNLTSPSPDIAVFCLAVVTSGQLVALVVRPAPRLADLLAIGLLAGVGAAVKLSLAGFAAATVAVATVVWLRRAHLGFVGVLGRLVAVGAACAAGIVPWMIHGVYLSGYPLFPSTVGGVAADWAVPRAAVVAEADLIRYWNGVRDWWTVPLRDPMWFARWLVTLGWLQRDVLLPLGLAVVVGLAALAARRGRALRVSPAILLPTLGGLAFCFAAAPRARYGGAGFWLLAVQATVLAYDAGGLAVGRRLRLVAAATAVALAVLPFTDGKPAIRPELTYFESFPRPELTEKTLATGLRVLVPGPTMSCWDGPLECTPYPNEALARRDPADLGAGFRIDPHVQAAAR